MSSAPSPCLCGANDCSRCYPGCHDDECICDDGTCEACDPPEPEYERHDEYDWDEDDSPGWEYR